MSHLRTFFDKGVAGQSMRAGGATSLAEHGAAPILIQCSGRWTSDSFLAYVRKNPGLMSRAARRHRTYGPTGPYVRLREPYRGPPDTTSYGTATAVPCAVAVTEKRQHTAVYGRTAGLSFNSTCGVFTAKIKSC